MRHHLSRKVKPYHVKPCHLRPIHRDSRLTIPHDMRTKSNKDIGHLRSLPTMPSQTPKPLLLLNYEESEWNFEQVRFEITATHPTQK